MEGREKKRTCVGSVIRGVRTNIKSEKKQTNKVKDGRFKMTQEINEVFGLSTRPKKSVLL